MDRRELSQRRKRVGRKAIATVRVAISIDRKLDTDKPSKQKFQFRYSFKKWHLYVALAVVAVVIIGGFVINAINTQIASQKATEAAKQQKAAEADALKRNSCREKITTEKADQLGTMTYDQLYGDNCQ
jgi:flagellar biosynthesis/type III secretory pathway M-ring protein FliF/YscJ